MTPSTERRARKPSQAGADGGAGGPHSLVDIMYDGLYALFLLKNGCGPHEQAAFVDHITRFLGDIDSSAKKLLLNNEDVEAAKYAFCAAVDEIILRSPYPIRAAWETKPLQLRVFGDQLAGEHFFHKLEALRARGSVHLQALEVFHLCLLCGFQGRYALDGVDQLNYLTARLGEEIARMRGKQRGFAPHAERPDQIANTLRSDMSLWVMLSVFVLAGLGAYAGFRTVLGNATDSTLAGYSGLVKLPPRAANVSITLP